MRRLSLDQWSGLAMLVVSVGVGGMVLIGTTPLIIPRGWWLALFVVFLGTLLIAADERPRRVRYAMFAVSVVSSWAVVLTAPDMGLLPILLVVTVAVSVYAVPPPVGLTVIGLNTVVLVVLMMLVNASPTESMTIVGFYIAIQLATMLSSLTLIREQQMRRELTTAHIDLRAASALLSESARTAERLRISRELHDVIGHQLTVLTLELEAARHREGERAREHVDRADRVARDLLADVRATVGELRVEPADLTELLRQVGRGLPGLEVSIDVDPEVRLDEERTAVFVRAVQEIVTNTIRHAEARELWIEVSADSAGTVLTAVDDGRGDTEPMAGNGLRGLTERFTAFGGDVTFDGSRGFKVTALMPT
ncbi:MULTISPECIES: sensor histidine kinase [Actinoalloteichus]|uniref:Signal transduction histidine kinase n=1 Tax=Actinoalloteichus fjordicus TaxID=1612552 RepID=A0AAC9LJG7_9PSEU|nr:MULTISPECIES: histidine kinase [Actinoalloteichus]APU17429.1 signal transduction histidine kinase [Actinoalloteichus fjordicus]APU23515.1 signal transduction histidine kinase [Actinoalloteichus sp. GBA129-24]